MLRLPCIGDLHLQHTHRRNGDRLQALDQILDEASAMGAIGAWLFLGDLYHQRSSIEDRNDLSPRIQRAAEIAPVVILYGNHDGHGDLEILARLKARFLIHVIAAAGVIEIELAGGERAAIFGVPYLHKHALVAAGVANDQLGDTAAPVLDAMFLDAAGRLRDAAAAGAVTVMIGHGTIAGSRSSVGQPMGLDRDIAISAGLLGRLGDVPKIWGHIHKPQEIYGAYYAGSVCRNDWGECEDKRWLLLTAEQDDLAYPLRYDISSHAIDIPKMYHVEGELSLAGGFTWRVKRGPDGEDLEAPASWQGADVRVRYRFAEAEASALDLRKAELLALFAETRSLELEPIVVRERAHRAPEVTAAKTLPARVAAFVELSGVPWTSALDTKFAALQEPDAAAFLARVHQELSGVVAGTSLPAPEAPPRTGHAIPDSPREFDEVRA